MFFKLECLGGEFGGFSLWDFIGVLFQFQYLFFQLFCPWAELFTFDFLQFANVFNYIFNLNSIALQNSKDVWTKQFFHFVMDLVFGLFWFDGENHDC